MLKKYYLRYYKNNCHRKSFYAGFDNIEDLKRFADSNCDESYEIWLGTNTIEWVDIFEEAYYRALNRIKEKECCIVQDDSETVFPKTFLNKLSIILPIIMMLENWIPTGGERAASLIIRAPLRILFYISALLFQAIEVYCFFWLLDTFHYAIKGISLYSFPIINVKVSVVLAMAILGLLLLLVHSLSYLFFLVGTYIVKEKSIQKLYAYAQTVWGLLAFLIAFLSLIISIRG